MVTLETERLRLRMFREADLDAYAAMSADPEVMRYVGATGQPLTRPEAWRQMAMFLGHWQLRGYGVWAVEERASGAFVGRIGLFNPDGWPGLECIWALARGAWGQGYATEGARRALDYAFTELDQARVISLIRPGQHGVDPRRGASRRAARTPHGAFRHRRARVRHLTTRACAPLIFRLPSKMRERREPWTPRRVERLAVDTADDVGTPGKLLGLHLGDDTGVRDRRVGFR